MMTAATAMPAAAAPGTRLWVSRYDGPANPDDNAAALAVSPGGGTVFVTGTSNGDYVTVAYRAATGAPLWARRYKGPAGGNDSAASVAVSPDGGTVFVTGASNGTAGNDAATIAYRAATGAWLWTARYHGPGASGAIGRSVAVSPTSRTVYITGDSIGSSTGSFDYATVGYDAATGRQLWARRYNGPGHGYDSAASVAVSPGSGTVLVTGASTGTRSELDYATVAYRAATGDRLWTARYHGPGTSRDEATSVATGPGGRTLFVTGTSMASVNDPGSAVTVAYRTATGARLWASRYRGRHGAGAASVAAGPGGQTVFITGSDSGAAATVAYRAATGARLWASRYDGPGDGTTAGSSVAVGPGGHTVYVAGSSGSYSSRTSVYATIAYHAATGGRRWSASYRGPGGSHGNDGAAMVAASPAGGAVFVTGTSYTNASGYDFATIAYRG
jgi:predicted RNA-binding protein with TRAM domain